VKQALEGEEKGPNFRQHLDKHNLSSAPKIYAAKNPHSM
jgi:hypothetical protein